MPSSDSSVNEADDRIAVTCYIGNLGYAGGKRVVMNFLKGCVRAGAPAALLTHSRSGPMLSELPDGLPHVTLSVGAVGRYVKPLAPVVRFIRLCRALKRFQTNVLLVDGYHTTLPASIYFALFPWSRRQLVTRMGRVPSSDADFMKSRWRRFVWCRSHRRAALVIVPSASVKQATCTTFGLDASKVQVVPNFVDLNLIRQRAGQPAEADHGGADRHIASGGRYVLYVGRLIREKNVAAMVEAMSEVDEDVALIIFGSGPEEGRLKDLVGRMKPDRRIFLCPPTSNPYFFMKHAQLFLFPTVNDGFGFVVVESFACGTPVIALGASGGPSELVTHEVSGLLVDPSRGAAGIAEAMNALLRDDALRERLSTGAEQAAEAYGLEQGAENYLRAIRNACVKREVEN